MPDLCEMQIWTTVMPGETQDSLLSDVKAHLTRSLAHSTWLRDHPPDVRPMGRILEGTSLSPDHPFVCSVASACETALDRPAHIAVGPSGDGYVYANYGNMPLVLTGPGPVHRAHAPDEYITVDELLSATKTIALLIADWCGGLPIHGP